MTARTRPLDAYREQITRLARALTAAEQAPAAQDDPALRQQMWLFADENFAKRREKLQAQLALVEEAFDGLDGLLRRYVGEVRSAAYDTVASDADRFLRWLERAAELTPEQRDHVACQRARHAVEAAARQDRWAYVRFQELWSVADRLAEELGNNPDLVIHLNPSRAWSRFTTRALLDEESAVPAEVLFFAAGGEVRTALLEPAGQTLVRELASLAPCTLGEWAGLSTRADRDELAAFCRDLSSMGLVAFA